MFIGMVMAVQMFSQFNKMGLGTRLGSMINITIVRELGPVLAATMLAGRVGCAMAAELATMRVSEQVDALSCLGANPLHYLVVPRLLACTLLIPLLTVMADFMGIMGGALICTRIYGVESHFYWANSEGYVKTFDVLMGLIKATFFGIAIALISCHRGLNSQRRRRGRGPGVDRGVRRFLRGHSGARLLPDHPAAQRLRHDVRQRRPRPGVTSNGRKHLPDASSQGTPLPRYSGGEGPGVRGPNSQTIGFFVWSVSPLTPTPLPRPEYRGRGALKVQFQAILRNVRSSTETHLMRTGYHLQRILS